MDSGHGLGKLLPKAMSAKRRRRKQKQAGPSDKDEDTASSRRLSSLGSDETHSAGPALAVEDDDDALDTASFTSSVAADVQDASRARPASKSAPPPRPATLSAHPSLIGYLTTSSPVVQANHLDSQPRLQPPAQSDANLHKNEDPPSAPVPVSETCERHPALRPAVADPTVPKRDIADGLPRALPRLQTGPLRTPPVSNGKPTPVILNTPPTPIEHTKPLTGTSPHQSSGRNAGSPEPGVHGSLPTRNMSAHRRSSSGSTTPGPSKLSNVTTISLTPTAETSEPASSASGFFSTVISAAQNAATTLSNTIPGASGAPQVGGKNRSALLKPQSLLTATRAKTHPTAGTEPSPEPPADQRMDQEKSALRTLGSGDLSLSQLGFSEPSSSISSPIQSQLYDAAADVRVRSESAPADPPTHASEALSEGLSSRPRSLMEAPSGDRTPPLPELADHKVGVLRNPSIRSAVKGPRKRGSSVTTGGTGTTVGAAATALQSAATSPNATSTGPPKLTGFAIASKKRNRDFHNLFKSVPDNDYLIEDYSCALQREILAHGRLYVSEGHLCFSSNILGWTTTLVMSFDEIVSVEKRSTALVFKNGLMISTLHAKHIFASFTSRDATYDLIINIWKLGHPTLKSTLNGVRLVGTGGDKTEKVDPELPGPETEIPDDASGSAEDESDDDDDDDGDNDQGEGEGYYDEEQSVELAEGQAKDAAGAEAETESPAQRKVSPTAAVNGVAADAAKEPSPSQTGAVDFPGPATHAPTDCGDSATHFEKVVGDDVISAPLGKVFNLVFGAASVTWMSKWLTGDQKCTDLQMEDRKGLTLDNRTRHYSYVKPLNASIGPKQTKCIVAETLENFDLEKAINLNISTQNPDVPSGNVFSVKTKYCLSWAEGNATRVQVNCTTEWTGKSWLKGPIEKGVTDGQTQYCRDLFAALKAAVSSRSRVGTGVNGAGKGKKKLKRAKALQSAEESVEGGRAFKHDGTRNWGVLEPVRALAEPLLDLLQPILGSNMLNGLLLGIIIAMWFGFGLQPGRNVPSLGMKSGLDGARGLAAHEEMWRREDGELWEWLDERVGMELVGLHEPNPSIGRPEQPGTVDEALRRHTGMRGGEMEEALRVTEEKLRVLKEVVGRTSTEPR